MVISDIDGLVGKEWSVRTYPLKTMKLRLTLKEQDQVLRNSCYMQTSVPNLKRFRIAQISVALTWVKPIWNDRDQLKSHFQTKADVLPYQFHHSV